MRDRQDASVRRSPIEVRISSNLWTSIRQIAMSEALFASFVGAQAATFAGLALSGKIPPAVLAVFRALLTL